MNKHLRRALMYITVVVLLLSLVTGCTKSGEKLNKTQTGDELIEEGTAAEPKEIVTLHSIYPGDEPAAMKEVLEVLNQKLGKDIGVNLELSWVPWDQYYTKVEIGIAANEKIDYAWNGSSNNAAWAAKRITQPLDEYLEKYGERLIDSLGKDFIDTMKVNGKIMGMPMAANTPKCDTGSVLTYREDLRLKYNLPKLDSIDNIEKYFKAIKENEEGMSPLVSKNIGYSFMRAFGPERFLGGTSGAVAYKINSDNTVEVMPIQKAESWLGACRIARKWYTEGYLPEDILNIGDVYGNIKVGTASAANGSPMKSIETQGAITQNIPDAILADQLLAPNNPKVVAGNGGDALYLTSVTKHPAEVVKLWSWIITNQENFDLYCYGIKDKHYEIKNDRIIYKNSDYASFPNWMVRNMEFQRFPEGISDEAIAKVVSWDDGATISPLLTFSFNPENVKSELAQYSAVLKTYSSAVYCGTIDIDKILPELEEKFKAAGQDKILEEARRQIEEFLQSK